jgi:hypothetical protein
VDAAFGDAAAVPVDLHRKDRVTSSAGVQRMARCCWIELVLQEAPYWGETCAEVLGSLSVEGRETYGDQENYDH